MPATIAYRYRQFDLGGLTLVTRCEVHGVSVKNSNEAFVATYVLNEYDPKLTGAAEWRKKIDSQVCAHCILVLCVCRWCAGDKNIVVS